jgi:hypothetical protein
VGVRIGTLAEWTQWIEDSGFVVEKAMSAPMRLLEPDRMLRDEGLFGVAKFLFNVARTPGARKRLMSVRSVFRKYQSNLCAVALVRCQWGLPDHEERELRTGRWYWVP